MTTAAAIYASVLTRIAAERLRNDALYYRFHGKQSGAPMPAPWYRAKDAATTFGVT